MNKILVCLLFVLTLLTSIACVSAVNVDDANSNLISSDISEGALSVSLDEINNDTLSVSDDEVLTAGANDWYVDGSAAADGNGSQSNPFKNFNDALKKAKTAGDTIHIAGGTYSGELNVNRVISTSLNLVNWGNKEVIFDGTGFTQSIFIIQTNNININGLTFKNGGGQQQGGALRFNMHLTNSHINAKFINNSAENGGAIYFEHGFSNCVFKGDFINNFASNNGGAICISTNNRTCSNNIITANFIGNSAIKEGGAIYSTKSSVNKYIDYVNKYIGNRVSSNSAIYSTKNGVNNFIDKCLFINNTAQSIIYIDENGKVNINNNIFLNNKGKNNISFTGKDGLNADNNWFGHNNTNYKTKPLINGTVDCESWLFLKGIANPLWLKNLQSSEIKFRLFSYNKTSDEKEEYNNALLKPVNLTVTSINGTLNKEIISLGDTVTFTLTGEETASVTSSVEDVENTIMLNLPRLDPKLSVSADSINYTENATFRLVYNNNATGKVNITVNGTKYNKVYTKDINEMISFFDPLMAPGEYNVTVAYSGDYNFTDATVNTTFTVNKINPPMGLSGYTICVTDINAPLFTLTSFKDLPYDGVSVSITPADCKLENRTSFDDEGNVVVDMLNQGNPAGEYLLKFTSRNSKYYNDVTWTVISRILLNPGLVVSADIIDYAENATFRLVYNNNATGKVNITVNGTKYNKVYTNLDINETISFYDKNMRPGEYNVTVAYSGDDVFAKRTANTTFTVNKIIPPVGLKGYTICVTDINASLFTLTLFKNLHLDGVSVSIIPADCKLENRTSFDDEGNTVVDMLNQGNPAGNYLLKVTSCNSDYYIDDTWSVISHIFKLDPGLAVSADSINYTENATFRLVYNNTATGKVNITVSGTKYSKVYSNLDINEKFSFFDPLMAPGEYKVTVAYSGNDIFNEDTVNTTFTVNKINPPVGLKGYNISVTDINAPLFTLTSFKDLPYDGVSVSITPAHCKLENRSSFDDEGNAVVDMLNQGNPAGEYLLKFTSRNSKYYNDVTWTVISHIFKLNPGLSVSADSISYNESATFRLTYNNTATGKVNITVSGSNYSKVYSDLDINEKFSFFDPLMAPGEYKVTVTYSGNDIFTKDTANTTFTVNEINPPTN